MEIWLAEVEEQKNDSKNTHIPYEESRHHWKKESKHETPCKETCYSNIISPNEVDELSRLCSGKNNVRQVFVLSLLAYISIGFGSFFACWANLSVCTTLLSPLIGLCLLHYMILSLVDLFHETVVRSTKIVDSKSIFICDRRNQRSTLRRPVVTSKPRPRLWKLEGGLRVFPVVLYLPLLCAFEIYEHELEIHNDSRSQNHSVEDSEPISIRPRDLHLSSRNYCCSHSDWPTTLHFAKTMTCPFAHFNVGLHIFCTSSSSMA